MAEALTKNSANISVVRRNEATTLNEITIVEKSNSKLIKDINSEELKSADLAEALMKISPNISIVRRNGIANDIILRGQKKDNKVPYHLVFLIDYPVP